MKNFPFTLLFLCVFLPPICYVLTIQGLEKYLETHETAYLNKILIRNQEALFEGRYSVQEEVNRNIGEYLSDSMKYAIGIRVNILVKTRDDHVLYPSQFRKGLDESEMPGDFAEPTRDSLNYTEVAADNFRIMNEGLTLYMDVRVKHNGWLSNSILILYIFISLLVLTKFIKKGLKESEQLETKQKSLIKNLSDQLHGTEATLREVKKKEADYQERIKILKEDKKALSKDIDGLLDELEDLETGLVDQRHLKESVEQELVELKNQLDELRLKGEKPKQKKKKREATRKRFKTLYKNLAFSDRAIDGFLALTDEFQLKAEETVHRLDRDESTIAIKRKVFGKGGKMNVLETDFSYSGRIYFKKNSQSKIQIVAIGTKNTQDKDLTYLESIK